MTDKQHDFFLMHKGVKIDLVASIDTSTGKAFDVETVTDRPILLSMHTPIRRLHNDGNERGYDARLVNSTDSDDGELKLVVQLSRYYVTLRDLALAAAEVSFMRSQLVVQSNDPEVIKHVTR